MQRSRGLGDFKSIILFFSPCGGVSTGLRPSSDDLCGH